VASRASAVAVYVPRAAVVKIDPRRVERYRSSVDLEPFLGTPTLSLAMTLIVTGSPIGTVGHDAVSVGGVESGFPAPRRSSS
jgi:hypothetical protein